MVDIKSQPTNSEFNKKKRKETGITFIELFHLWREGKKKYEYYFTNATEREKNNKRVF